MENEIKSNAEKLIETTIEKLCEISSEQIVGKPIKNDIGQTVIPVSNLTLVSFGGGGEYGDVKVSKAVGNHFAGGSFTVCSLKPNSFLVDNGSGFRVVKGSDSFESVLAIIKNLSEKLK